MRPCSSDCDDRVRGVDWEAANIAVSVVMPCLDEEATVADCVRAAQEGLRRLGLTGEVLVADNGSRDSSRELARREGARVVVTSQKGYGAAILGGIAAARGTFVILGDSDGTYDFTDLDKFWQRLQAGDDLVIGNRFHGGIAPGAMPWLNRYLGNPALTGIGRILFRAPVRDFHCGLRAFRRSAVADLRLECRGMEFATEMVAAAALGGLLISEVPTSLSTSARTHGPHMRPWRDGLRHLNLMLRLALRRRRRTDDTRRTMVYALPDASSTLCAASGRTVIGPA